MKVIIDRGICSKIRTTQKAIKNINNGIYTVKVKGYPEMVCQKIDNLNNLFSADLWLRRIND